MIAVGVQHVTTWLARLKCRRRNGIVVETGRPAALALLACAGGLWADTPAQAATLTSGVLPGAISGETVGGRFRGQSSGNEHYVGVNDLGVGANRSEQGFVWPTNADPDDDPTILPFEFAYGSADGNVSSLIEIPSLGPEFEPLIFGGTPDLFSDALVFTLSNRSQQTATFTIVNLTVNGEDLPDLSCDSFCQWTATDFAVLDTLSVSGDLELRGQFGRNDSERVRFEIASSAVDMSAIPVPPALGFLAAAVAGLAVLRRRRRADA